MRRKCRQMDNADSGMSPSATVTSFVHLTVRHLQLGLAQALPTTTLKRLNTPPREPDENERGPDTSQGYCS